MSYVIEVRPRVIGLEVTSENNIIVTIQSETITVGG